MYIFPNRTVNCEFFSFSLIFFNTKYIKSLDNPRAVIYNIIVYMNLFRAPAPCIYTEITRCIKPCIPVGIVQ